MENISVNKAVETEEEVIVEDQVTEEQEDQEEASEGSEGTEEAENEGEETEIVLEGDDGSQPDQSNLGIRKRINKLNAKVSDANDVASNASAELENERQKNKLLQLALEQKQETATPSGPPDPLDFDGGASDTKYVEALNGYISGLVREETAKHIPEPEPQTDRDLEVKQKQHYEAADKLNISDYEAVEDVAVGILGKETVNHLIKQTSNSPVILYYLGKNPEKAERIAELVKANPIKGVMELGALEARLKVTKVKRNQAPNPDDVLEGALSPSKGKRGPAGATYS